MNRKKTASRKEKPEMENRRDSCSWINRCTRPEAMRSQNREKDAELEKLWRKMLEGGISDPLVLMAVVSEKDYYDLVVLVKDYHTAFIRDVLLDAWDDVCRLCRGRMQSDGSPFQPED